MVMPFFSFPAEGAPVRLGRVPTRERWAQVLTAVGASQAGAAVAPLSVAAAVASLAFALQKVSGPRSETRFGGGFGWVRRGKGGGGTLEFHLWFDFPFYGED